MRFTMVDTPCSITEYYFALLAHTTQYVIPLFANIRLRRIGMEQKPLKDKICISLDSDIVEKIKNLAEEDDRSFSSYINKVLKDYLKKKENSG